MTAQSALTLPDSEAAQIQIWRAVTVAACVGIALVAITGILVPAGLGWDFANFYDTGRRAAAGQLMNIYDPTTTIAGRHLREAWRSGEHRSPPGFTLR
jgi:hypothetical protein